MLIISNIIYLYLKTLQDFCFRQCICKRLALKSPRSTTVLSILQQGIKEKRGDLKHSDPHTLLTPGSNRPGNASRSWKWSRGWSKLFYLELSQISRDQERAPPSQSEIAEFTESRHKGNISLWQPRTRASSAAKGMPTFTGLQQPTTTQLLLKYGVKLGVLHQENVFFRYRQSQAAFWHGLGNPKSVYMWSQLVSQFHTFRPVCSTEVLDDANAQTSMTKAHTLDCNMHSKQWFLLFIALNQRCM